VHRSGSTENKKQAEDSRLLGKKQPEAPFANPCKGVFLMGWNFGKRARTVLGKRRRRLMKTIALLGVLACVLSWGRIPAQAQSAAVNPTVTVKTGELRGSLTSKGVVVFKNIPFAQPPIGDLRWREPLPAKSWAGVRDAAAYGPACVQTGNLGAESSEDCLQLNVWTPKLSIHSHLPVMVWIHGGGNFAGSGVEPLFNGEAFARHGVVLVTVNYRLGIFGFFAHPELTRESPHHASGNYGLLDQIMALHWVHDNIAKFGGDPANVTIFGESAGAADVNLLMATPFSEGLFERVIAESGPVVAPPTLAEWEKKGEEFAAKLNIAGDQSLARLRALPSDVVLKAAGGGLSSVGPLLGLDVDGWVLPESPVKVFAAGKEMHVGLILGNNSQELQRPFFPMQGGLNLAIANQYGPLADRALALYGLNGATEPQPDPELGTAMAQWATDSQFRCGSVAELIWHTDAQNPGYQYQFSLPVHGKEALGAPHGSEVQFVFGALPVPPNKGNFNETDQLASAQMQEYWTNFAKTGDPNGGTLPKWPKFDATGRSYLDFTDAGPQAKEGLQRPICDLFMENQKRLMTQ
jgi:para-nitrobenzyl esterase